MYIFSGLFVKMCVFYQGIFDCVCCVIAGFNRYSLYSFMKIEFHLNETAPISMSSVFHLVCPEASGEGLSGHPWWSGPGPPLSPGPALRIATLPQLR